MNFYNQFCPVGKIFSQEEKWWQLFWHNEELNNIPMFVVADKRFEVDTNGMKMLGLVMSI